MSGELEDGRLYTTREVVAWLRHKRRWFYDNKASLTAEGFPLPISSIGQPRWRGAELNAWARRARAPAVVSAGNVTVLAEVASARSKALAAGRRTG